MILKRYFQVYTPVNDAEGKEYKDQDGASYSKPHPSFEGKEFANPNEVLNLLIDTEREISVSFSKQEVPDQKKINFLKDVKNHELIIVEKIKIV